MLKLSEFWSARAHSEDFTLTRMGFMTVRLRLLICVLMVGLPAWALVDWLTLPATQFEALLQARVFCLLALSPLIPLSYLIHFRRERMKLALGYLMGVMMLFSLICLHSFGADQELQAGYMAFPYLLISLFAIFPIPLSLSLQLSGGILVTMLAGNWLLVGQSLWSVQTLNQIWLLGLFAVASAWVQCGQLNMLLQLYRESTTDELTGMMNRRLLMKQLEKARAAMIRKQAPFAVLLLDLDRFKRINDTFGHLAGDAVLREVATTLVEQLEPGMVLGRYGGEEFAILLPRCPELAQAKRVAERLRVAVEARLVKSPTSDELLEVTVSIGLTLARRGEGIEALLNRADECLYRAKMAGRNCVVGELAKTSEQSGPTRTDAA
ncbi:MULTISPECIES: GGDEF domain-containing protein [unclassified Aeromonas]|uniref:GGDEF domain-containing protein n=1 Tax=Aeromonas TaxID=642 RepID=UPI001C2424FE|nr:MULTISPECIES: GGDEF domain-containing protein [unclassified Aeromonas]QXC30292.1 GGDEF domain-containing protein [Aeromonas sp. FDAARGOS 1409]WOX47363.1 GGDEF domain-containing protein [Aeromonas sp. XH]